MKDLHYVTGNKDKFKDGQIILDHYGIRCVQQKLGLEELQASEGEEVARHKATQAWQQLQEPLIVNDTTWIIPSLKGFPGIYMSYVNYCFSPQDWLQLLGKRKDRKVIMREILVYKTHDQEKVFFHDVEGEFLHHAAGNNGVPSDKVISLNGGKSSIAQDRDKGWHTTQYNPGETSYDRLGEWLQEQHP